MRISQYTYVLENGRITMSGESEKVRNDPRVVEMYLGKLASGQK